MQGQKSKKPKREHGLGEQSRQRNRKVSTGQNGKNPSFDFGCKCGKLIPVTRPWGVLKYTRHFSALGSRPPRGGAVGGSGGGFEQGGLLRHRATADRFHFHDFKPRVSPGG